jgi:C4-dicarboxylate-specific signal transduction histidine kinase
MDKKIIQIPVSIHPRAFAAFGDELVTNDNIVLTELVKNCYDAYAFNVDISLITDGNEQYLEIADDGIGMSVETVKNVYATIATPFKEDAPVVTRIIDGIKKERRVSGNKGVGRFSIAKLGKTIFLYTKTSEMHSCILVKMDWNKLRYADSIENCLITLDENPDDDPLMNNESGTVIRIKDLQETWTSEKFLSLRDELSRLLNPFKRDNDFSIRLIQKKNGELFTDDYKIELNSFIDNPIYSIDGEVTKDGTILWHYKNNSSGKKRSLEGRLLWERHNYENILKQGEELSNYICGAFSFEIRVWDLDSDSVKDISTSYNIKRSDIRKTISRFKGLSVYRDNILVLPKSDTTKDWLGLDAKRISEIGKRISTSQIVGMVNISSLENPGLRDTTNRENMADTLEYKQFTLALLAVIGIIQNERLLDRLTQQKAVPLNRLLDPAASQNLVNDVESAINNYSDTSVILKIVKNFHSENTKRIEDLTSRLIYYAQTASLGSVALVIMHEFLTGMTSVKRFLNKVKQYFHLFDKKTTEYYNDADNGHKRLTELVNSFAPLCMKDLHNKNLNCDLYTCVKKAEGLIKAKKISKDIEFDINVPEQISVLMSEGELQTILINLFDNACYWIKNSSNIEKQIYVTIEKKGNNKVSVVVSDTGEGVLPENAEKIFLPGVTSKINGLGMGLVIVTELLSYYNCKIGLRYPSDSSGATFVFDLPIKYEVIRK